ncbi:MAG: 5'/3'-nucleotidase SurE [Anaerolineae bacterium]|nr:5'/3'-nucleotidase SurE [Anaerolineae bacterium]
MAKQILVTNDDGIRSPAIWVMAEALTNLGDVVIAAPREQFSGAGRSHSGPDGEIESVPLPAGSRIKAAYAVATTPAKAVIAAFYKLYQRLPDLVVSGINYGENPGTCITSSGTVGAAIEAAASGVRALAVSRVVPPDEYLNHSDHIDFNTAAHFTAFFAERLLDHLDLSGVDLLKVDVPAEATPRTPWKLTRLSRYRYFEPFSIENGDGTRRIDYRIDPTHPLIEAGDDVHGLLVERVVTVTPLTIDMTARVNFGEFGARLKAGA